MTNPIRAECTEIDELEAQILTAKNRYKKLPRGDARFQAYREFTTLQRQRDSVRRKQNKPVSKEQKASLEALEAVRAAKTQAQRKKELRDEQKAALTADMPATYIRRPCIAPTLHVINLCDCENNQIIPKDTKVRFEEIREMANKTLATRYLRHFVKQAWPLLYPTTPLEWGDHIEVICNHVQNQLMDRWQSQKTGEPLRAQNLLINIPPRSLKTTILSLATVWAWLHEPEMKIMYLSSNPRVSVMSARWAQAIVRSEWFKTLVDGAWLLKLDHDALTSYGNSMGGTRTARSLQGAVTGEGADWLCHTAGTKIATATGEKDVEDLRVGDLVWSINHKKNNTLELQPVTGTHTSYSDAIVEVATLTGNVLCSTNDHRIWTVENGYLAADQCLGTTVSIMPTQTKTLLDLSDNQSDMHSLSDNLSSRSRGTRQTPSSRQNRPGLFTQMSGCTAENRQETIHTASARRSFSSEDMSILHEFLQNKAWSAGFLFNTMQKRLPRAEDAWSNELELRERRTPASEQWFVGEFDTVDQRTRWESLYGLSDNRDASRPPHRPQSIEQHSEQSDNTLSWVSQLTPQITHSTICSVEPVTTAGRRETHQVFSINVARNHNYFANGILVHNCIDDPHDVRDSEMEIRSTVDGYDAAVHNRINDPKTSIRTAIMQRFKVDDFSGHVLEVHTGDPARGGWLHVRMPTEFVVATSCTCGSCISVNVYGWQDPRTIEGEVLHPRFTPEFIAEEKRTKGPYGYAGQHQQEPAPPSGGMLKNVWYGWFRLPTDVVNGAWKRPAGCNEDPAVILERKKNGKLDLDMIVISVDGTFGNTKESSGSAVGLQVYGLQRMRKFCLDDKTDAIPYLDALERIRHFVRDWAHEAPVRILVEPKAFGPMAVEELRRDLREGKLVDRNGRSVVVVVEVLKGPDDKGMAGDKITRAHAATPALAAGLVLLREGQQWTHAHVQETGVFPNGKRDDRVDSMTQVINFYGETNDIAKARALLRR